MEPFSKITPLPTLPGTLDAADLLAVFAAAGTADGFEFDWPAAATGATDGTLVQYRVSAGAVALLAGDSSAWWDLFSDVAVAEICSEAGWEWEHEADVRAARTAEELAASLAPSFADLAGQGDVYVWVDPTVPAGVLMTGEFPTVDELLAPAPTRNAGIDFDA